MQLNIAGQDLKFKIHEEREQWAAPFVLPEWAAFRSENSNEEFEGENVLLLLEAPSADDPQKLAAPDKYANALEWFMANQSAIKQSALTALCGYIDKLRNEYGIEDEELDAFESEDQLTDMVDISYVRIYPQSKDGKPYFALEMECNWDPDGGCGIMFHGATVVDIGGSDSAQGAFDIEGDGGA